MKADQSVCEYMVKLPHPVNFDCNNTEYGGIYIHIPFCIQKCRYCDFYSIADVTAVDEYIASLIKEMELQADTFSFLSDSLYFGGGTPSLLSPHQIHRILKAASRYFHFQSDTEITLEANPGTINRNALREYYQSGINRINIGVQSFHDDELAFLGRIHSVQDACNAVEWAELSGFENIGIDLIYGLPGQRWKDWKNSLRQAVSMGIQHLSCYMLTYETGTPLDRARQAGKIHPMPDEQLGSLFERTSAFLQECGYNHYEISNFALLPHLRSRHNQKYWSSVPYLGLGPSAHSFIPPERRWNRSSLPAYLNAVTQSRLPVENKEELTKEQEMMEAVYLGFRTREGIDIRHFEQRFDRPFNLLFEKVIALQKREGMLISDETRCNLTLKGMRYLDSIAAQFVCQDF